MMMDSVEEANRKVEMNAAISAERMLSFFRFGHLPPHLQEVSKPFCELAVWVVATQPQTPERTVCLRKLLEAKDCAVRNLI